MESVTNLSEEITIIMVAHRLSSLKGCDRIYELSEGIMGQPKTFEEIIS